MSKYYANKNAFIGFQLEEEVFQGNNNSHNNTLPFPPHE